MRTLRKFLLLAVFASFGAHADPDTASPLEDPLPPVSLTGLTLSLEESPWLSELDSDQPDTLLDPTEQLVSTALELVGTPYRLGGTQASTGFDCSGFVQSVFADAASLELPRIARDQAQVTAKIKKSELRPGDLVFFNTMRRAFSHVGIYIGNNQFVHAPRTGSSVRVETMNNRYWSKRFNGARRVLASAETD